MKTLIYISLLFLFLFQGKPTALEQVKNMKGPVIVVSRHYVPDLNNKYLFMIVSDGEGHYIDLNRDSTLLTLTKKYTTGDTIR